ncbi:aldose reductase [Metarhizium brunneum]
MTSKVMTVNDGSQMPAMAYGVGTAHLSKFRQIFGLPDFDSVPLIVEALNMGHRHIDTAERERQAGMHQLPEAQLTAIQFASAQGIFG